MAAKTPLTGNRVTLPPGKFTPFPRLPSTEAKRSGQAERSGEGGFGVSRGYDSPTRARAEEAQTKRSGQAERSGE